MSIKVCCHPFAAKLYISYMKPLHWSGNCILKMILVDKFNYNNFCILRSGSSREVEGVQTSKNTLCSKAIVVAAGSWSGSLMHDLLRDSDILLDVPVKPRKVSLQCELTYCCIS